MAANLVPAGAAIALFVLLAPESNWDPVLIGALAAIAAVAFAAEVRLKISAGAYFDASIVLALLTLAIAGPLPALLVWMVPDAISRFVIRQDHLLSPGLVATVSSFALATLAGYGMLQLANAPSIAAATPALYTTGLLMYAVNFLFARLTFAPFYQGYRPSVLVRTEFLEMMPPFAAMLALGVATAVLIGPLGVFALAPLAVVVVLPQLALAHLGRNRSITRLRPPEATRVYADAIADVLGLSRRERHTVAHAAMLLDRQEPATIGAHHPWHLGESHSAILAALHVDERWDGTGSPAGLRGAWAPLASRVVAVARAWSNLTAGGTLELSHSEAMLDLSLRADEELDPAIVEAACQVVAEERTFVRAPEFQPRLHRLPLPRTVRRAKLPAVLAHLTRPT
ncbi:MAG TPA: HD domain-containing phosphohydrolase [Solirubrobacterales bacterium]|nr:HD domain-containing phosphohydrolase [Solirubrobacterales bacterium]